MEVKMVEWLSCEQCTGCSACSNICPVDALEMKQDDTGFIYPEIDENKCIHCNLCHKICDNRNEKKRNFPTPQTYAAWNKDPDIRYNSTSGGVFSELASVILKQGGVVIGAQYNHENLVEHTIIEQISNLHKIRQSKYIQSDIGLIYRAIKEKLSTGRKVLFCGAPCQIAGLYAFLGEDNDNLITIDFICRGVNSPKAYKAWLNEIEHNHNSKVSRVWFKYKQNGWKKSPRCTRIDFVNGEYTVLDQKENLFMNGYLNYNLYMRPSCGNCEFKGMPRQADITLADFWGIDRNLDDDKGTSMVLINNKKGELLLTSVRNLVLHERNFDDIFKGNTYFDKSVTIAKKSSKFLKELDRQSFSKALKKYGKVSFCTKILNKIKYFIKNSLAEFI